MLRSLWVALGSFSCEALDLACNLTALCHVPEWDCAKARDFADWLKTDSLHEARDFADYSWTN